MPVNKIHIKQIDGLQTQLNKSLSDVLNVGNTASQNILMGSYSIGFGTILPSTNVHIVGGLRYVDGTQANGYILTSDSNGLASWTASTNLVDGNGIFDNANNGGTVSGSYITNLTNTWNITGGSLKINSPVSVAPLSIKGIDNTTGIGFAVENSDSGSISNTFYVVNNGDVFIKNKAKLSTGVFQEDIIELYSTNYSIGLSTAIKGVLLKSAGNVVLKPSSTGLGTGLEEVVFVDQFNTIKARMNVNTGMFGIGIIPTAYLHVAGGNVKFEGLTDTNLFNTNYSTDSIGIGGLPQTGYKLKTYGSVNIDNGLALFNNTPVSLINIKFVDKNLTKNGITLEVINSAAISNGRAVVFNRSGGTGNTLELYASGGSNALSVQGAIISNSNSTSLTYVSTLSAPTTGRFRVGLAGGIFTSAYYAVLKNVGSGQDNIGFNISGTSVASLNANYIALKGVMISGTANNIFGTHITLGNQANLGTANTYGHFVDWNGSSSNSVMAISGTHRGFFADMRSPQASDTINGDVYGIDIDMGAGTNTVVHNGIHRGANFVFNDANTTPFKNIGIEIDMTLSKAITSYGLIVNGSNSGFGITSPTATLHVSGSVRLNGLTTTPVAGNVLQSVDGLGNLDWVDVTTLIPSSVSSQTDTRNYTANITQTIPHTLGTSSLIIQCYGASGSQITPNDITIIGATGVSINFTSILTNVKTVIMG